MANGRYVHLMQRLTSQWGEVHERDVAPTPSCRIRVGTVIPGGTQGMER